MQLNSITLKIFDSSGLASSQTARMISKATGIKTASIYPGGYSLLSCFVPCDITTPLEFQEGCKIIAYNWGVEIWHGFITSISWVLGQSGQTGIRILSTGAFGWVLGSRKIEKWWADNRLSADVWVEPTTNWDANDKTRERVATVDRGDGRLRITPKPDSWPIGRWYRCVYTSPTGQTVKRVKGSHTLAEGAQNWSFQIQCLSDASFTFTMSASGSTTSDATLANPSQILFLELVSGATQTPSPGDGTYYGEINSNSTPFMVYSETGSINAYEVAKDIAALYSELSTNYDRIDSSLNVAVEPFITQGKEAAASVLARICSYGTSAYKAIGYAIWGSQETSDGKPQLVVEPYPVLTSYEYVIDAGDPRLIAPIEIVKDVAGVVNWVCVRWTDGGGFEHVVTPDDDANLKDTASIALYGQREADSDLHIGLGTQTLAIQAGRALLSQKKDPRAYVSAPIKVYESMRASDGGTVAVSEVRAGQRVRLVNVADDVFNVSGTGATFVITDAEYSDDDQTLTMSCGVPDDLAHFLASVSAMGTKQASSGNYTLEGIA